MEEKNVFVVCSEPTIAVASAISQTIGCSGYRVTLYCETDAGCEQATDAIRKLLEEKEERAGKLNYKAIEDSFDYPLIVNA